MRVTEASTQTQFLANLDSLESNISQTQNQISTGLSYTLPSQDPAAAGQVDNFQQCWRKVSSTRRTPTLPRAASTPRIRR